MNEICKYDVLAIREYFPSNESPSSSTWVFNQTFKIQEFGIKPIVLSPTVSIPSIIKPLLKTKHYQKSKPNNCIENYKGVDVIRPRFIKLPSKYFLNFNLYNLKNIITKTGLTFNVNIIHSHFGHAGVASIRLKEKLKKPLITSFYGFDLGSDKKRLEIHYKKLAENGDLFLTLSSDMTKDLINLGFPENKIKTHHLGVNLQEFKPVEKKENETFVFLIVATFVKKKGIKYAIQAFRKFKTMYKTNKCVLKIVGDGVEKYNLQALAGNVDDIIFINNFECQNPRETVLNEMQNCDVFVLTSITDIDKEGTPVALMEAQACGKPCISSFHAGIPEVVINKHTGLLAHEKDIDEIVNSMSLLYFDHEMRKTYGENALKHISREFNNEIQTKKLYEIYNSFIH